MPQMQDQWLDLLTGSPACCHIAMVTLRQTNRECVGKEERSSETKKKERWIKEQKKEQQEEEGILTVRNHIAIHEDHAKYDHNESQFTIILITPARK